ncbi:hypothetical protein AYI70_g7623 [Smittium culicis]|uniref:Uncharacterized protein n=1 Tax=Smittium culicis TaxID=133412 RepID=A0A1R1X644_9FUNG|nr:hypothetical protein AYI70_g10559 [Smittium culicis]OMJ14876.1 hypothetical protein AYI70_g7623 [Smittium culicis]
MEILKAGRPAARVVAGTRKSSSEDQIQISKSPSLREKINSLKSDNENQESLKVKQKTHFQNPPDKNTEDFHNAPTARNADVKMDINMNIFQPRKHC